MDLYTALQQVAKHQKIRRFAWDDPDIYIDLQEGIVSIHNDEKTTDAWIISISDLTAPDWTLLDNEDIQF